MDKKTKTMINSLASDIRQSFGIPVPVTDIDSAVSAIGGTIVTDPRCMDSSVIKEKESFRILLPEFSDERRRRFAAAQELGHLFLHMGYLINDRMWNRYADTEAYKPKTRGPEEQYRANEFASALLMPEKEYADEVKKNASGRKINMGNVAEHFGVTIAAASYRGKLLGCII